MKKIIGKVAALAMIGVAVAGMSGCKEKDATSGKAVESISFEMYNYDVIAEITDSDSMINGADGGKYVRIQGEGVLPKGNGKGLGELRDSLLRLTHVEFADDSRPIPSLKADLQLTDLRADTTEACSFVSNMLSASLVSPRVMVFENQRESYICQAAHGIQSVQYVNYDIEKGRMLSLSMLMKEGYQRPLTEMIRKAVKAENLPLMVEENEIEIPDRYSVTSTGLQFSFEPYEIAPYSEGIITVSIPTGDLVNSGILNAEGSYLLTGE